MKIFNNLSPVVGCQSYHKIIRLEILCVNNLSQSTSNWIKKGQIQNHVDAFSIFGYHIFV